MVFTIDIIVFGCCSVFGCIFGNRVFPSSAFFLSYISRSFPRPIIFSFMEFCEKISIEVNNNFSLG